MAGPTQAQKLAAAHAALSAIGVADLGEVERFVALFWSQVPLLPAPATASGGNAIFALPLQSSNPALQARLDEHTAEARTLAQLLLGEVSGGSPSQ